MNEITSSAAGRHAVYNLGLARDVRITSIVLEKHTSVCNFKWNTCLRYARSPIDCFGLSIDPKSPNS